MPKIFLINNEGSGFANTVEVDEGITAAQLFTEKLPDRDPSDFLIRVNREQVEINYVLREGDRVTMTPTKIEGAK